MVVVLKDVRYEYLRISPKMRKSANLLLIEVPMEIIRMAIL